jgi:hypothetical protein
MTIEQKIAKKGYSLRSNLGMKNGQQVIASYSALKNGKEEARATSKTALLKKL